MSIFLWVSFRLRAIKLHLTGEFLVTVLDIYSLMRAYAGRPVDAIGEFIRPVIDGIFRFEVVGAGISICDL